MRRFPVHTLGFLAILSALPWVVGCPELTREDRSGDFSPSPNQKPPGNAVVHIAYKGKSGVSRRDLIPGNFRLREGCAPEASESESTEPEQKEKTEPENAAERPPSSRSGGKTIPGSVTHRTSIDGQGNTITDVYFVPLASGDGESPLRPGECYAFEAKSLRFEKRAREKLERTEPRSGEFTIDESSEFSFSEEAYCTLDVPPPPEEMTPDNVVLLACNEPVSPDAVRQNLSVCTVEGSGKTQTREGSPCASYGYAIPPKIFLVEELEPETSGNAKGVVTASFTTYAVAAPFRADDKYIVVLSSEGGFTEMRPAEPGPRFTVVRSENPPTSSREVRELRENTVAELLDASRKFFLVPVFAGAEAESNK